MRLVPYLVSALLAASVSAAANADMAPATVTDLRTPESVLVLRDGTILISEIGEFGKDGDGAIVRIKDGQRSVYASGLNDPKGLAERNGIIYVADKDHVMMVLADGTVKPFLKPEQFPKKPQFLNDLAFDMNTIMYISDSGDIQNGGGGAIFRATPDARVHLIADSTINPLVQSPNGLSTVVKGYVLVVDFHTGDLYRIRLRDFSIEKLAEGFGGGDGIAMAGTKLYISDWKGGKLWSLDITASGTKPVLVREGFAASADIDSTPDSQFILVPEMKGGRLVAVPVN
jgi:sugar lactone lactonase YvrE